MSKTNKVAETATAAASFNKGDLPVLLQEKKQALEADGWAFGFDKLSCQWSAVKENFFGWKGYNDFDKLIRVIEKRIKEHPASASVPVFLPAGESEIPIDEIVVSPLTPQASRRHRFKDEELEQLADSIKKQGLINAITVRQRKDFKLEIVAGERRFEAVKLAGLPTIRGRILDLSDEQALEIQLQENLQRVDVDPLDEAFAYKYLMENMSMAIPDLVVKFAKTKEYISLRLKLNLLIPEVLDCLTQGHLPLGHAIEISKFNPAQQSKVLECCFDTEYIKDKGWQPDKTRPLTFKESLENISNNILLELKSAVFPTNDKRLRADGLTCLKCPERTGAKNSLFEEYNALSKSDRCLNADCFTQKTAKFINITRAEASAVIKKTSDTIPADYRITVISWIPRNQAELQEIIGDPVLIDGEYMRLRENAKICKFAEPAIFLDDSNFFGDTVVICRNKTCPKHLGETTNSSSSSQTDAGELKRKLIRQQEIFDVKVGEAVRLKVLTEAAAVFSSDKWVFDDERWRILLLNRLWGRIDDNARKIVHAALGKERYAIQYDLKDEQEILEYFNTKLTADERSQMLFLCIVANKAEMLYGSWRGQAEIMAIGEEFGIDYRKLDAAERLQQSPKKYKHLAQEFYDAVERGEKDVEKPIFYKVDD